MKTASRLGFTDHERGILQFTYPLAWMAGIFFLSSIPGIPTAADPPMYFLISLLTPTEQDLMHIPAYAAGGFLWLRALAITRLIPRRAAVLAVVLTGLYGFTDEWHQYFVPGRSPSLGDVLRDWLGAWIGVGAYRIAEYWLRRRSLT